MCMKLNRQCFSLDISSNNYRFLQNTGQIDKKKLGKVYIFSVIQHGKWKMPTLQKGNELKYRRVVFFHFSIVSGSRQELRTNITHRDYEKQEKTLKTKGWKPKQKNKAGRVMMES